MNDFEAAFMKRLDDLMKSLAKRLEEQAGMAQEQLLAQHQAFLERMYGAQQPDPPVVVKT